jgi:alcohol dehydrogenase
MRELNLIATGRLEWIDRPDPVLKDSGDAIVRPIVVGRCDGDTLPIHRHVSRAMQAGLKAGLIDPAVAHICGPLPFAGPFAIGHECVGEVLQVGSAVTRVAVGDRVVVPWSISCGACERCRRGLTSKCLTTRRVPTGERVLAAYGFGSASGSYGGMVSDLIHVPFADHMLVPIPNGLDPLRVAAASDNLADAWRAIVPHLRARPGARVLVVGGGAQSIGLYAAGLAVAHGARTSTTSMSADDASRSPTRSAPPPTVDPAVPTHPAGPTTSSSRPRAARPASGSVPGTATTRLSQSVDRRRTGPFTRSRRTAGDATRRAARVTSGTRTS